MFSSRPSQTPRRTTDLTCCGLFLLALGAFVGILVYAYREGNPHLLLGLRDADGQACGSDVAVQQQPYLFFCPDASGRFSLSHGSCVDACPETAAGTPYCAKAYASLPSESNVCLPAGESASLLQTMEESGLGTALAVSHHYTSLFRAWPLLLGVTPVLSVCLGVAYLRFLKAEAQVVFWVSFLTVLLSLGVAGVYYLQQYDTKLNNDTAEDDEAANGDLLYGVVGCSLAALTLVGAILSRNSIRRSFPYLEAAGECLADLPTLFMQPFLETIKKVLLLNVFLFGALCFISCRTELDGALFASLAIFTLLVFAWLVEVCGSLSRYVLGYLTEEFVFSPYDSWNETKQVPVGVTGQAYKSAIVFHFGSLCFGSIANVALKPLRMFLCLVTLPVRFGWCGDACQSITSFYARMAAFSDSAYLAMALDGHSYLDATKDSLQIMGAEGQQEAAWLDSTLLEIQLLGAVAASTLVAIVVRIIARSLWTFNNPGSMRYVEDDGDVAFAAFIVALACTWSFMECFGYVADALIFSFQAQSRGYLGLSALVSERASLCEVPDCFGGDNAARRGHQAGFSPFTNYPPKLTNLLTFINNRKSGFGSQDGSYGGYGGYGGFGGTSRNSGHSQTSGWGSPR